MKKIFSYIIILSIFCISCIDKFPLGSESYENLLVVDGVFHNGPGTYSVKLSRSSSVSNPSYMPVKNAQVKIIDESGPAVVLDEVKPGHYQTSSEVMQGQVGHRYKLSIVWANGVIYESPFIELKNSVAIDSVYAKFEINPTANPDVDLKGYQFYINTGMGSADSTYFLWQCDESYKYHAAYTIDLTYYGNRQPAIQSFNNKDSLFNCWKTGPVSNFWTKSTINLNKPQLSNFELNFVSTITSRLSIRYSLLVKQYNITSEAFDYWTSVKEQITNDDILFNSQVHQLRGNVSNVDNPYEPVMGYFTVAGYSQKRIFVDRPEDVDVYERTCPFVKPNVELRFSTEEDWPIFLTWDPDGNPGYVDQNCFDCRAQGGELEVPSFWIDAENGRTTNINAS